MREHWRPFKLGEVVQGDVVHHVAQSSLDQQARNGDPDSLAEFSEKV
jgi:hypothetical protein